MTAVRILEGVLVFAACVLAGRHYLHMFQLESYQRDGYRRWIRKSAAWLHWPVYIGGAALLAAILLPVFLSPFFGEPTKCRVVMRILIMAAFAFFAGIHILQDKDSKQKKPLVYTNRMKRLYAVYAGMALIAAILIVLTPVPAYLLVIAVPFLPLLAAKTVQPYEDRINHGFFVQAQQKLESRTDLIKIGITGSYGKTSTKFALQEILSEKYSVYASPASFNTPMGLSNVINNRLKLEHQVFIAEMGARHVGDIKELCDLVRPSVGLITSVGPQHLETFGDIETVANTKFEIIESLRKGGCGFFAADGGIVDGLYERAKCEKYRAGLSGKLLSVGASDIEVGPFGSRFTLTALNGDKVRCETKLLGEHNIQNITLASAVALKLGLTLTEIARGIKRIQPVEHRLQLIPGSVSVIDDAFNSNPKGSDAALQVLAGFPGRHIIVTPGMVELGDREQDFNREFGRKIADCCDAAILVGKKRSAPIYEGIISSGFDKDAVYVVSSLAEAQEVLGKITRSGDVVLFENDLPDNYTE